MSVKLNDVNDVELHAVKRTQFGKYFSQNLRKSNKIPVVAYNKGKDAFHFIIDFSEFLRVAPRIKSEKVFMLKSEQESFKVIIKSVQRHPVSDLPIHIDFHIIEDGQKIKVKVPVELQNQSSCLALKSGGFLNLVKRKIEVYCDAKYLPRSLPIDIKNATIGASIRISDFTFPENVECFLDPYTTVITIAGKKAAKLKESELKAEDSGATKDGADKGKKAEKKEPAKK